jgi:hypothetical protein
LCCKAVYSGQIQRFGGTYGLHHQGRILIQAWNEQKLSLLPDSLGLFLWLLFNIEDGDDIFLRIVGLPPNYPRYNSKKTIFFTHSRTPRTIQPLRSKSIPIHQSPNRPMSYSLDAESVV